jgi:hypothetical protein
MFRHKWVSILVFLLCLKLAAQSDFCADLLIPTLEQVSSLCSELGRNEICYGNNLVEASFIGDTPVDFTSPSDIAPVPLLESLHTTALDNQTGLFGVAVMQVQSSNIPNSLPGQVLTFLLVGEVTVENDVAPEEAFVPVDPIETVTTTAANIRLEPDSDNRIIGSVPANTSLALDARNEAGDWYRVSHEGQVGWVSSTVISQTDAMSELPVINRSSRTAMQAFYVRTGIGVLSCEEAPSQLIIQGPQGLETSLTINGAEVRIGSTIALSNPSPDRLRLSVLDGYAIVGNTTVPGGFSVDAAVSDNHIAPRAWHDFKPLPAQELEFFSQTSQSIGQELTTYAPDVPSPVEVQIMEETISGETPDITSPDTQILMSSDMARPIPENGDFPPIGLPTSAPVTGSSAGLPCLDSTVAYQGDISFTLPEQEGNGVKWTSTDGTCSGAPAFVLNIILTTDYVEASNRCASIAASGNPGFIDLSTEGFPGGYSHCWG